VRVSQLGGHVEVEILGVNEDILSHFKVGSCAFLVGLLQQNRSQSRSDFCSEIFDEDWRSKLDAIFKISDEVIVGQFDDFQLSVGFLFFEPFVALSLRIDHERPSPGVVHDDAIFDRKVVVGKAVHVPLSSLDRLSKHFDE
jgi:hypothetical protein